MWDLPEPGLKPVSPALAGGFLTTAPPGKPKKRRVLVGSCCPGPKMSKAWNSLGELRVGEGGDEEVEGAALSPIFPTPL